MKLVCPECRRENEPERIYCHECGARLDRSVLAKAKTKVEDPKETQRRLRSMLNPKGARLRQRIVQGSKLLLGAVVVAGLVQMFRAPELPEKSEGLSELPSQINLELEDASMAPPGRAPLRYTEDQINAYLSNRFKSKRKTLSSYLQFERAVAGLDEGAARVTIERSVGGFSVFTTAAFAPRIEANDVRARVLGGKIGRLPIHPELFKYCDVLFADVRDVVDRERKSIAKLGTLELHPQTVILTPKAAVQP